MTLSGTLALAVLGGAALAVLAIIVGNNLAHLGAIW